MTFRSLPLVLLALAVLSYAVYFSVLTITRYNAFESRALDMGNLNQAIWNTAHGNWFHLTNQPGTINRLSLHVEPIILPIAALYRLWPDPRFLLLLQSTIIALGALPAYAIGRWKLANGWLALVFAGAFLLHPAMQAANWLEFHPVALAPTFLLAAFYFLATRRAGWFALFAVLAASCKEEIALLVFMMGLYAFVVWKQRRTGAVTMVFSMTWALLAVLVIQNIFAAGNIHWERYGYLGDSPGAIVWTMLTQPGLVWAQLQDAQALRYIFLLMLPVAFTALFGLDLFLLALPSLGINLLAAFPPMHQVDTLIYAAPIVPFVIIGGIFGTARLVTRLTSWSDARADARLWQALLGSVVAVCAVLAQVLYGYLPGAGNHTPFTVSEHDRRAANVIVQIPPTAAVSAQDKLNPHVSGRETVYIFPRVEDADTVFVDVTGPAWPQHPNDVRATVDELLAAGWGVAAAEHGYLLLRKDAPDGEFPAAFYEAWHAPQDDATLPDHVARDDVQFAAPVTLLGHAVESDEHGELVTTLYLRADAPLPADLGIYIAYLDQDGAPIHDSLFYPPVATLWYPTTLWTPGTTVAVRSLPWTLDRDAFTLAVGLYDTAGNWVDGPRIPVTDAPRKPRFEGDTLVRLGGYQRDPSGAWIASPADASQAATQLDARFGDAVGLAGADVTAQARAGQALPFTLTWQAAATPETDFSVFAHLLDGAGEKVAQLDWQPHDAWGPRPMTTWLSGETLADTQTLTLPATLPAGEYTLIVGVYDWQTGARLPVQGTNAGPGDVVQVGVVHIEAN